MAGADPSREQWRVAYGGELSAERGGMCLVGRGAVLGAELGGWLGWFGKVEAFLTSSKVGSYRLGSMVLKQENQTS